MKIENTPAEEVVKRLLSFYPTYGWPEEAAITVQPTLNVVAADLITHQAAEIERLRERIGPRGLEVVMIDGTGHYVSEAVAKELTRQAAEIEAPDFDPDTNKRLTWRQKHDRAHAVFIITKRRAEAAEASLREAVKVMLECIEAFAAETNIKTQTRSLAAWNKTEAFLSKLESKS